jgi:putative ABC transport system permease protein
MRFIAPLENSLHSLQLTLGFRTYTFLVVGVGLALVIVVCGLLWLLFPKSASFILKNLRRNLLRTVLAGMAIMVLALVVTLVWSILVPLDAVMTEKTSDFKVVVSERWQVPSQMPYAYASTLEEGGGSQPGDIRVDKGNSMTWTFYGGSLEKDPSKISFENFVFMFAMDPRSLLERETKDGKKVPPMMDELEHPGEDFKQAVHKLIENKQGCILGRDRLKAMNKRVGERIKVYPLTYKDLDLDFDIVGTFPDLPRYNQLGVMHREYIQDALDSYPRTHNGNKHPLADKNLNLVWLRVADSETFSKLGNQIMSSPQYTAPAVKTETAASGTTSWLKPYETIFFGVKWLLVPVLFIIMAVVMAMAISISVRERRTEMAVLKVLGFTPGRILAIVLGEAVLVGALSGFFIVALAYTLIQSILGGIPFPIAWFSIWPIPTDALWWGPAFGAATSLLGSLFPAWAARNTKVSEVFAKIA